MPRNARTSYARYSLRWAIGLFAVLAATGPWTAAVGQEQDAERNAYLAQQRRMHQGIVAIRNDLNAGAKSPTQREQAEFARKMARGIRPGAPDFPEFQRVLRYSIFRLSDPGLKDDPVGRASLRTRFDGQIRRVGSGIPGKRAAEQFREVFYGEVVSLCEELLQNNYLARSMALELLPFMLVTPPRGPANLRRMYPRVADVLADVVSDPLQPDTVKLRAAMSMTSYVSRVAAGGVTEARFASVLEAELRSPLKAFGYQLQMVEVLRHLRTPRSLAGDQSAVVYQALAGVVQDKRRPFRLRCRAAGALGEAGFDTQINFVPLAWKVTQLAVETGDAHNADPGRAHWPECGLQLYLAFKARNAAGAQGKNPQGMLNRAPREAAVNQAYAQVLPIAQSLIFSVPQVPQPALAGARQWVTDSQPEDLKFDPASPALQP